jgi:hypothetical protein
VKARSGGFTTYGPPAVGSGPLAPFPDHASSREHVAGRAAAPIQATRMDDMDAMASGVANTCRRSL